MNWKEENSKVAQWIKDYADKAGITGAVIGLSGGIDSAVIACLAVEAFGKDNVIGVSIPCQSREDMNKDAKKLAVNLGIRFQTVQIRKSVAFLADSLKMAHFEVNELSFANMKARERMNTLYAIAGPMNYLVVGTGNKSELMVGYFTKFGDGGVDMEPLGNYYKTEVYKMAAEMNEIPNAIKVKAPTADLWGGQTDEEELGMKYKELDEILEALETGSKQMFDKTKHSKVVDMIRKSVHKNNLPPRYDR